MSPVCVKISCVPGLRGVQCAYQMVHTIKSTHKTPLGSPEVWLDAARRSKRRAVSDEEAQRRASLRRLRGGRQVHHIVVKYIQTRGLFCGFMGTRTIRRSVRSSCRASPTCLAVNSLSRMLARRTMFAMPVGQLWARNMPVFILLGETRGVGECNILRAVIAEC